MQSQSAQANIDRRVIHRSEPFYIFRQTTIEAEGVPALVPPDAAPEERIGTVVIDERTLYIQRETHALTTCHQRQLSEQVDPTTDYERRGLLHFEQYISAASEAIELDPGGGTASFNSQPADHYSAESTTIWTDTQASLDIWVNPANERILGAELQGEGLLPPYGEGQFQIEISVDPLPESIETEIPEACETE